MMSEFMGVAENDKHGLLWIEKPQEAASVVSEASKRPPSCGKRSRIPGHPKIRIPGLQYQIAKALFEHIVSPEISSGSNFKMQRRQNHTLFHATRHALLHIPCRSAVPQALHSHFSQNERLHHHNGNPQLPAAGNV